MIGRQLRNVRGQREETVRREESWSLLFFRTRIMDLTSRGRHTDILDISWVTTSKRPRVVER